MVTFGKDINLQIQKAQETPKQGFKNNNNNNNNIPLDIVVRLLKTR